MQPSADNLMLNLAATELGLGGQLVEQRITEQEKNQKKKEGDPTYALLGMAASILGL
jgi:hypothetical protein